MSLGVYPKVSITNAIDIRDGHLEILKKGDNPREPFLIEKQRIKNEQVKQSIPVRFLLDHDGGLYIKLGHRTVILDTLETNELRKFLIATVQIRR